MEIITNFLYQLIFSVGILVAFGVLIYILLKLFCKITGSTGTKILLITGVIGTPVHELSHALMCIIFGHKVIEIKLYQPNSNDGTLGYVKHTFNPKNLYQQIGNFFIGVAPIIFGSGILLLLMYSFVPSIYSLVTSELQFVSLLSTDFFDFSTYAGYFDLFLEIFYDIINFNNFDNIWWWIFIVLAIMISSHMELSITDIKEGLKGLLFVSGALLITDIVIYFAYYPFLESITTAMTSFAVSIASFLAISVIFLGIMVFIALSIKTGIKFIKK